MSQKIIGKLQTPPDGSGVRTDIHPITSAEAVVVDDTHTLKDTLEEFGHGIQLSQNKPEFACLWAEILSTD